MDSLLVKPTNELTKSERELLKNELNEMDKDDIRKELEKIRNHQEKDNIRITTIEEEQKKQEAAIKKIEEDTNVLCAPFHSKRKKVFSNICKNRVRWHFAFDKSSPEYVLFSPFFFKRIYGDIANEFDLGSWHDISMKDYENPGSMYNMAIDYAKSWFPSDYYVRDCIDTMVKQRDGGILAPERCRALTQYLEITNNGKFNPFVL